MTFTELSDEDKNTIYNWAINRDSANVIKNHIKDIFKTYSKSDINLQWRPEIVEPLWFRVQSIGSMLHSDIPYIFQHTNLLRKISGQKLLISGIDMKDKQEFIGNKSHHLKQKLLNENSNKCSLCSYQYEEGDVLNTDDDQETAAIFCDNCYDANFGLYTVWTALDYFQDPFNHGSLVFCIGSHNKYKGYKQAIVNNESVPKGFSNKSLNEKQNLQWGYVNDIKPGDQFIFNVKTLHASATTTDGYLRPRVDMRVALRPSLKRYVKELTQVTTLVDEDDENKENESPHNECEKQRKKSSHLGLSQLCSQPTQQLNNNNEKNTKTEPKLGDDDDGEMSQKSTESKLKMKMIEEDTNLSNNNNDQNETRINIQDRPTQANDNQGSDFLSTDSSVYFFKSLFILFAVK